MLARSFDEDPVSVFAFPHPRRRGPALRAYMRGAIADAEAGGLVHAAVGPGGVLGVAAWMEPGRWRPSTGRALRQLPSLVQALLLSPVSARMVRVANTAQRAHPREEHWYLQTLGVDPSRQGEGIGRRLIRPVLDRADAEGLPCYLETATRSNVAWYAGAGFAVVEELRPPGEHRRCGPCGATRGRPDPGSAAGCGAGPGRSGLQPPKPRPLKPPPPSPPPPNPPNPPRRARPGRAENAPRIVSGA